jgi:ABC-2 type transport system ATP-binding protein
VEIRALLKDLKADGKSILLASHNAQDIEELCDHVKDLMLERNEINE